MTLGKNGKSGTKLGIPKREVKLFERLGEKVFDRKVEAGEIGAAGVGSEDKRGGGKKQVKKETQTDNN